MVLGTWASSPELFPLPLACFWARDSYPDTFTSHRNTTRPTLTHQRSPNSSSPRIGSTWCG